MGPVYPLSMRVLRPFLSIPLVRIIHHASLLGEEPRLRRGWPQDYCSDLGAHARPGTVGILAPLTHNRARRADKPCLRGLPARLAPHDSVQASALLLRVQKRLCEWRAMSSLTTRA